MAEHIEASIEELQSGVLALSATDQGEELNDLMLELHHSHIHDWSDEKRDKFALKLCTQLEFEKARSQFPPQKQLQSAIDTLNFEGNSALVCCYECKQYKARTKADDKSKPYINIGKCSLLMIWKTRSFDPGTNAIKNTVKISATFDGNDCYFPPKKCGNISVLHHRGDLRQGGKVNKGYVVYIYLPLIKLPTQDNFASS